MPPFPPVGNVGGEVASIRPEGSGRQAQGTPGGIMSNMEQKKQGWMNGWMDGEVKKRRRNGGSGDGEASSLAERFLSRWVFRWGWPLTDSSNQSKNTL